MLELNYCSYKIYVRNRFWRFWQRNCWKKIVQNSVTISTTKYSTTLSSHVFVLHNELQNIFFFRVGKHLYFVPTRNVQPLIFQTWIKFRNKIGNRFIGPIWDAGGKQSQLSSYNSIQTWCKLRRHLFKKFPFFRICSVHVSSTTLLMTLWWISNCFYFREKVL